MIWAIKDNKRIKAIPNQIAKIPFMINHGGIPK